jgi:AAA+ ATPase superfamily predicted ATPase|tara:strand:- start:260 stop:1546 length:1287 start_codon:yes stop_codon:yes gene_type:complete
MQEKSVKLRDAFGIGREIPQNYVEREEVDKAFLENLSRDKHIVIYGSSKQGKTTLRKHCLEDDDYIVVSCVNTMTLDDLNGAILKSAGFQIEQTNTKTVGGHLKYGVEFRGEAKIPLIAKAGADTNIEKISDKHETRQYRKLEIDLNDVNDIILSLKSTDFRKFVVLEDFHYLPVETQQNFSFCLKVFHENSAICFIVIGVWREKNRLIYYNGDLTNRVSSIDVDTWSKNHLNSVICAGEQLLNVSFDKETAVELVDQCSESVSLLQEACFRICETEGVYETQSTLREIGSNSDVRMLMKDIVNDQAGRYLAFINNFAEGFQQTNYDMYRWIMYVVLRSEHEDLESGIRRSVFSKIIKEKHPVGSKLNEGNITQALQSAAALQVTKNIRPIIIDYDQTTRVMHVVDRSFLIWLALQDRNNLIEEIGII